MDRPTPPAALLALAAFLRERLGEVSEVLAPLRSRRDGAGTPAAGDPAERSVATTARDLALVVVGAAAPFATTSYSRIRLIRQMHAGGLLTDEEVRRVAGDEGRSGAPL